MWTKVCLPWLTVALLCTKEVALGWQVGDADNDYGVAEHLWSHANWAE